MAESAPKFKPGDCFIVTESGELKKVEAPSDLKETWMAAESTEPTFKPPPRLKREPSLQKKPTGEELENIKVVFAKFDKDSSGQIDLQELQTMCGELGKTLTDAQAAAALSEMDLDENGQVNFDEFLAWYTSKPGLGGYSNMALSFMKGRLKMENSLKSMQKRAKAGIEKSNDFIFKGSFDLSPNANQPSSEECSFKLTTTRVDPTNAEAEGAGTATIYLTMKDNEAAESLSTLFQEVRKEIVEVTGKDKLERMLSCSSEGNQLVFSMANPMKKMFEVDSDDEDAPNIPALFEDAVKKLEGKFSLGMKFEDMIEPKNLDIPILRLFPGGRGEADVNINLLALANVMNDAIPPEAVASLKAAAAVIGDARISYNQTNLWALSKPLKKFMGYDNKKLLKLAKMTMSDVKLKMFKQMCENGIIAKDDDGNTCWEKDGDIPPELIEKGHRFLKQITSGGARLDKIVIGGVPGCTLQATITCDQVNPFAVADYFWGNLPSNPEKEKLNKPQSEKEMGLLKKTFDKYDKDGSGSIDLKELKEMFVELGAKKITDEDVQAAMTQLDTNKDGTCSFDEFKTFWSSKSNLGGYSAVSLKLLKAKLAASDMLDKGKRWFGGLGSRSPEDPDLQDTVFKFSSEVGPLMEDNDTKMTSAASIDIVDEKAAGPPRAVLRVTAKSADAAGEVVAKVKEVVAGPFTEALKESFQSNLEAVAVDNVIEITVQPVEGAEIFGEDFYDKEVMRIITPIIKTLSQSSAKAQFANEFDDFLAQPDTPMQEVFKGGKAFVEIRGAAKGRQAVLDMLASKTGKKAKMAQAFLMLITGGELTSIMGYHKEHIAEPLKFNEMAEKAASPVGLKELLPEMLPLDELDYMSMEMEMEDWKKMAEAAEFILERLDALDSMSIGNFDLPVKYSMSGTPATVTSSVKYTNVKPFAFLQYLILPTLTAVKLGAKVGGGGGDFSDSDAGSGPGNEVEGIIIRAETADED